MLHNLRRLHYLFRVIGAILFLCGYLITILKWYNPLPLLLIGSILLIGGYALRFDHPQWADVLNLKVLVGLAGGIVILYAGFAPYFRLGRGLAEWQIGALMILVSYLMIAPGEEKEENTSSSESKDQYSGWPYSED